MQSKAHLFRLLKISRSKQRTYSVTDQVLQHSTKKLNNQTLIINRFDYYYYYITLAPHILTGNLKQFLKKLKQFFKATSHWILVFIWRHDIDMSCASYSYIDILILLSPPDLILPTSRKWRSLIHYLTAWERRPLLVYLQCLCKLEITFRRSSRQFSSPSSGECWRSDDNGSIHMRLPWEVRLVLSGAQLLRLHWYDVNRLEDSAYGSSRSEGMRSCDQCLTKMHVASTVFLFDNCLYT